MSKLEQNVSLEGKVVLVTGAAKRIGRMLALSLAASGAKVAITYLASADDAESTLAEIAEFGVAGLALRCDLSDEQSIHHTIASVVEELGGLDILVNNAGMFESVALESITAAQWDGMFAANTRGPFLMSREAYPHLKKAAGGGRIINIGSLGGTHAWATHAHYCTSKAALHMLSETMAKAWAPEISVNCVAPGMIVIGEVGEGYEQFAAKTPMKRNGTADDVASAVLFFATAPPFITGQFLVVDGGLGI